MLLSEADTRVKFIDTKLKESHWNEDCIKREYYFTDGRKLLGNKRGVKKFADYLLSFQGNNLAITSHRICQNLKYPLCICDKW